MLLRTPPVLVLTISVVGVAPGKVLPVTADKQGRTTNVCNHKRLFRLRLRQSFSKAMAEAFFAGSDGADPHDQGSTDQAGHQAGWRVETGNQLRLAIVPRPRGGDWLENELD
jgi:hypothetical protein